MSKPKTLEDAKKMMRLCKAANTDWGERRGLWHGYACELCGNCCPECSTPMALMWAWPELKDFDEAATEEEWLEYVANNPDHYVSEEVLER